jgi:hypothetical protein
MKWGRHNHACSIGCIIDGREWLEEVEYEGTGIQKMFTPHIPSCFFFEYFVIGLCIHLWYCGPSIVGLIPVHRMMSLLLSCSRRVWDCLWLGRKAGSLRKEHQSLEASRTRSTCRSLYITLVPHFIENLDRESRWWNVTCGHARIRRVGEPTSSISSITRFPEHLYLYQSSPNVTAITNIYTITRTTSKEPPRIYPPISTPPLESSPTSTNIFTKALHRCIL